MKGDGHAKSKQVLRPRIAARENCDLADCGR